MELMMFCEQFVVWHCFKRNAWMESGTVTVTCNLNLVTCNFTSVTCYFPWLSITFTSPACWLESWVDYEACVHVVETITGTGRYRRWWITGFWFRSRCSLPPELKRTAELGCSVTTKLDNSVFVQVDTSVRYPRKSFSFLMNKRICWIEAPKNILFDFENKSLLGNSFRKSIGPLTGRL